MSIEFWYNKRTKVLELHIYFKKRGETWFIYSWVPFKSGWLPF